MGSVLVNLLLILSICLHNVLLSVIFMYYHRYKYSFSCYKSVLNAFPVIIGISNNNFNAK